MHLSCLALVSVVACATPQGARPAVGAPVGAPTTSPQITVTVEVSAEARAMLEATGEGVELSVVYADGLPGDDGGYRGHSFPLSAQGGVVSVPPTDLTPVKQLPLRTFSIQAYSSRNRGGDNVLDCTVLTGDVAELPTEARLRCVPL